MASAVPVVNIQCFITHLGATVYTGSPADPYCRQYDQRFGLSSDAVGIPEVSRRLIEDRVTLYAAIIWPPPKYKNCEAGPDLDWCIGHVVQGQISVSEEFIFR